MKVLRFGRKKSEFLAFEISGLLVSTRKENISYDRGACVCVCVCVCVGELYIAKRSHMY